MLLVITNSISNHKILPQVTNMSSITTKPVGTFSNGTSDSWSNYDGVKGNTDYPALSEDSPLDFATKFKQCWDNMQHRPLNTILPASKNLFFHGLKADKPVCQKRRVPTTEVSVQTMNTAIPRIPEASRTHPIPWGLDTYAPSPLTIPNITPDHRCNSKKRKFEDDPALEDNICIQSKRPKLDDQDTDYLGKIFDYLKSPVFEKENLEVNVAVNEEGATEIPTQCEYEGFVEIFPSNIGVRSVATSTMHVPILRRPSQYLRQHDWAHTAMQFLSKKDRQDKRGPSLGTWEDKDKRMVDAIHGYYSREK